MFIFPDIVSLLLSAMPLWAYFDSLTATDMSETGEWRMKAGEKKKKKKKQGEKKQQRERKKERETTSRFLYDSNADEVRRVLPSRLWNWDLWLSRFRSVLFISQGLINMHTRTTVLSAAEANRFDIFYLFFLDKDPMLPSKLRALDSVTFSVRVVSAFPPMPPSVRLSCKHPLAYLSQIELVTCLVAVRRQVMIDFSVFCHTRQLLKD